MTTTTAPKIGILDSWDKTIDFVFKTNEENTSGLKETINVEVDCEKMKGTHIIVTRYMGCEDGEKLGDQNSPPERFKVQNLLLNAKGNMSKSFITTSPTGQKLFWAVKFQPK